MCVSSLLLLPTPVFFVFVVRRGVGDSSAVLPNALYSYCEDDAFATGVTVWSSDNYVYGVTLECANVTATCAPPNYPVNLIEEGTTRATIIGVYTALFGQSISDCPGFLTRLDSRRMIRLQ